MVNLCREPIGMCKKTWEERINLGFRAMTLELHVKAVFADLLHDNILRTVLKRLP